MFTGLQATTHFGRPQMNKIMTAVHKAHPTVRRVWRRERERERGGRREGERGKQTDRDRERNRHTDRQTETGAEGRPDRQTDR